MTAEPELAAALAAWEDALGPGAVLTGAGRTASYTLDTTPRRGQIPAVLKPEDREAVAAAVRIAAKHAVPVYPVSTGHNWGYGTANPVQDGCVLIDLSGMNRIVDLDAKNGLVTLEPGVTQRQLREALDQGGLRFLVPVTGAGPDCSLLGNALDRGYGITPYADHFGAVTSLEAVLPDGSSYRGSLSELGGLTVDRAFKWGLGPYLDGLFAQGSFGIVTQGTIVLAPTPPSTVGFFFSLARDEDLEPAMEALREVLNSVGSLTGAVNLMNARRVLAMAEPYPRQLAAGSGAVPAAILQERAKRYGIFPWTGVGALYGEKSMVEAAKRVVRQRLKGKVKRLFFMTPQLAQRARGVVRWLPAGGGRLARVADKLDKTLSLLAGQPSEIALPLAYLHSGNVSGHGKMNPALDGCGLIWYSPLVPMSADRVRTFVEMTERICVEHGIEPLITLTSISSRCLDSTVPILFDRDDPSAAVRADRCYRALFEAGRGEGFLPYRMGSQYMDLVTSADNSFWRLVAKIKQAVDPQGIMSPGRYCPLRED